MATINLLPWREARRQELKKEFLIALAVVVALALAAVFIANRVVTAAIEHQTARNNYLQQNIRELNRQVREISELERKRRDLLERMKIIQDLQGNRPVIVRIFDELVRCLPDGVFFQSVNRQDTRIEIVGIAESNNRVSSLMRNLDGSDWFSSPNLTAVRAEPRYGEQASSFRMTVTITTPDNIKQER